VFTNVTNGFSSTRYNILNNLKKCLPNWRPLCESVTCFVCAMFVNIGHRNHVVLFKSRLALFTSIYGLYIASRQGL